MLYTGRQSLAGIFFIYTNKYAHMWKLMQDLFRYMQNGRKIRVGFVQDAY